jgi:hypothetical protein
MINWYDCTPCSNQRWYDLEFGVGGNGHVYEAFIQFVDAPSADRDRLVARVILIGACGHAWAFERKSGRKARTAAPLIGVPCSEEPEHDASVCSVPCMRRCRDGNRLDLA